MRLLHAKTLLFTEFTGKKVPSYSILSHTWAADNQEVTFQDMKDGIGRDKSGYDKILFCAQQAARDELKYFWIDSCCIDKANSTELSEAINSMFRWYRGAAKCYVYLSDVPIRDSEPTSQEEWNDALSQSRWFTRGWTLQELLAPRHVEFYSRTRKVIGNKESLKNLIHKITGIPISALQGTPLTQFTLDELRSWTAKRETTIEVDEVYCLLGMYDIYLPLLYGETRENALRRFREEVEKRLGAETPASGSWTQDERRCMQSLRISDYERFKDRNPGRSPGTCQWFLQHEHFQHWEQNNSSCLLWVTADPGCGKSVLAKFLVDGRLKSTSTRTTCYFFFKDDSEEQRSISAALSSLVHQFLSQQASLIPHAIPAYHGEGSKLSESFTKLWEILMAAASDRRAGEVVIILDALDECEESGRYRLVDALSALYKSAAHTQNAVRLKFLVTSRPYFDIERRFKRLIRELPTIHLDGTLETDTISEEIESVIRLRVADLESDLGLDASETIVLQNELLSMRNRTYLWVELIIKVIRNEVEVTKSRLKRIVHSLPATVDQAYEAILSRVRECDQERARRLLHLIIAARRPLTQQELNTALNVENYHESHLDLDIEDDTRFSSSARNLCGLFISIVDQKVYLIHQTAKEFLITQGKFITGQWKQSFDLAESEYILASACISYLCFKEFQNGLNQDLLERHSFARYAGQFWPDHFRRAQGRASKRTIQQASNLCDPEMLQYRGTFPLYWATMNEDPPTPKLQNKLMVAAYYGHETLVKRFLVTESGSINHQDDYYWRAPLSWAAVGEHEAVIKTLFESSKIRVNTRDCFGCTPLSQSIKRGSESVVRTLLTKSSVDVGARDHYGRTPLACAVECGNETLTKLILTRRGIVINSKNNFGHTAFSEAVSKGYEGIVRLLLARNELVVDTRDHFFQTPFSLAALYGWEAIVKLLLQRRDVDVDSRDMYNQTPLLHAASRGHETIVRLLLETGRVNADAWDVDGRTPLWWAERNGHRAVVTVLRNTGRVDEGLPDYRGRSSNADIRDFSGHPEP